MFKRLAVPCLALLLTAAFNACSSGGNNNSGTGGKSGTGGAGTGGAGTGGAGTGGAGTGGAGTGGATTDGGTGGATTDGPADISGETAGETGGGDFCAHYVNETNSLPGIPAADFCAKYGAFCRFGSKTYYYSSMSDCMMKYGGADAAGQACRAGYLCNSANRKLVNGFDCAFGAGGGLCTGK